MKKTILSMAVISASILASCSQDSAFVSPVPSTDATTPNGNTNISITLTDDSTRATVSESAEEWENDLTSLTIYAFDNSENLLVRRDLSKTERDSKEVSFALPKSVAGSSCDFYAVANVDTSSATTKDALLAIIESDAAAYNGTFAEVTSKSVRDDGFIMSGVTTQNVGAENTTTSVGITIKRTVAKVVLDLTLGSSFAASYPTASLTFNSATISKAATQTPVVSSVLSTGSMVYTHSQSTTDGENIFYIYENGDLASGERVLMEINATFDADGSSATIDDQSEIIYSVELSGDGEGAFTRNGFYTLAATINGLVGQDCAVLISVADWETPVSQSVNLGM
ncbi:MAG: fimbrial protein [Rikenellaceae bacterium]